ncbi:hypothetical protein HRR83_006253 [Exophiala dermatitidis]|uniref:Uncharacterized protein n=1 Tax=Exophiala dermatitidis TaxID=5970 RepID=A0AAN6ERA5_EXODE|nr:hypothetical protein HRR73_007112 [Exophiala dermatitidis]KAJ4509445.1 hypothetical protein HRR74_007226 [Exophiala dermatitidis]KAJ4530439.1 hypothetical protein HRR76_008153 [Exophiala dermatitidis]KAJ4545388.1 hypothetical protein HRR77_005232 [Exophiala dermatitidis]KAJ4570949.1 hypothetical protein HRR79_003874 [Exophiala dermatitidis]
MEGSIQAFRLGLLAKQTIVAGFDTVASPPFFDAGLYPPKIERRCRSRWSTRGSLRDLKPAFALIVKVDVNGLPSPPLNIIRHIQAQPQGPPLSKHHDSSLGGILMWLPHIIPA